MEFERFALDPVSRRRFFHASGVATAGGSAALLAACGGGSGKTASKSAIESDIAVLNAAIDLENTAIAAYTAGAPLLKGELLKLGREFLGQEKEHADALSTAVTHLGGHPSRPKAAYDFPRVRTQRDVLLNDGALFGRQRQFSGLCGAEDRHHQGRSCHVAQCGSCRVVVRERREFAQSGLHADCISDDADIGAHQVAQGLLARRVERRRSS